MEFIEVLLKELHIEMTEDAKTLPALDLAYIGDNVYETANRLLALSKGGRQVEKLHKECSHRASAITQAKIADALYETFTEEEQGVYTRGRNAKVYTKAKNATIIEYHKATGLEALIGYLFLKKEYERMAEIIAKGFALSD